MRQFSKSQRRLAAGAFLIIAAPIVATSVAYACQTLATLHANPRSTTAGSTITVRGVNYGSGATNSNIEIRVGGRTGRVLASFTPRSTLNNEPVQIPADMAAGTHTLLATQYTASGNAVSGTPGRASLVITVAARTSSDGAAAAPAATASTDSATAPVAATPAEVTPAVQTASAPATSGGAAAATQAAPSAPAAAAATNSVASAPAAADGTTPVGPAAPTAAPAAAAPAAAAEPTAAAAGPASVNVGLLPASATDSSSSLPGLALAAGLAMVLLALGAFIKTGRNMLSRGTTPLAG